MIRSSACLSASDLSIQCRVRKSPYTTNPNFEDAMEMTCTMRQWQPQTSEQPFLPLRLSQQRTNSNTDRADVLPDTVGNDARHAGPELVLTQVELVSPLARDRRDNSPNQTRGSIVQKKISPRDSVVVEHPPDRIPLADIMVVETRQQPLKHKTTSATSGKKCLSRTVRITTHNHGFFEFDKLNLNSHDVLFAFLKANLPPERLIEAGNNQQQKNGDAADDCSVPSATLSISSSVSQMDADKLTQEKIFRSSQRESFSEKVTRRTSRLASLFSDLCSTICDSACCRARADDVIGEGEGSLEDTYETVEPPAPVPLTTASPTPSTKSISLDNGELEEEGSIASNSSSKRRNKRKEAREKFHMPSGLSIEPANSSVNTSAESNQAQRKQFREKMQSCKIPSGLSVEQEEDDE